ncbi:hypothetical protein [Spirosoma jeollabukense]
MWAHLSPNQPVAGSVDALHYAFDATFFDGILVLDNHLSKKPT